MSAFEIFAADKNLVVVISDERLATAFRAFAYAWEDECKDAAVDLLAHAIKECREVPRLPADASAA
jgi:hypothetical protein